MLQPEVARTLASRFFAEVWMNWSVPDRGATINELLPQQLPKADLITVAQNLTATVSSQEGQRSLETYMQQLIHGLDPKMLLTYLINLPEVAPSDLTDSEAQAVLITAIQENLLQQLKPYSSHVKYQ